MWKIFDGKEVANGVIFIKSQKDFNTVIDVTKRIGYECKKRLLNVNYWFLDASGETGVQRKTINQFLDEMANKNINLIVLRTLNDISDDPIEKEAFLSVMKENEVGVYLLDEGCFATVNYDYQKVIYPSEVVVYDSSGRRVVACPTEQEADEYIEEKVK